MNYNSKLEFEIDENKTKKVRKNCKDVALAYLEHRDRTCNEMQLYLQRKEYSIEEIKETIEYLVDMGYLCDETYVKKYIDYSISKSKGFFKIKIELIKKGINEDLINVLLEESEYLDIENEKQRAMSEALKMLKNFEKSNYYINNSDEHFDAEKYKEIQKLKAKIGRRLNSLGYSNQIVFSTINKLFKSDEEFL